MQVSPDLPTPARRLIVRVEVGSLNNAAGAHLAHGLPQRHTGRSADGCHAGSRILTDLRRNGATGDECNESKRWHPEPSVARICQPHAPKPVLPNGEAAIPKATIAAGPNPYSPSGTQMKDLRQRTQLGSCLNTDLGCSMSAFLGTNACSRRKPVQVPCRHRRRAAPRWNRHGKGIPCQGRIKKHECRR